MTTPAPTSAVLCGPWATPGDVPDKLKQDIDVTDDEQWVQPLLLASEILWMLSGRRWLGVGCEETVILRSTGETAGRGSWPYSRTWGVCGCWFVATWGDPLPLAAYSGTHISRPMAVKLPRSEVSAVTAVTIDGDAFADFELTGDGWLRRTDGQGWPVCGDQTSITYQFGAPPPPGGVQATVALAAEIVKDIFDRPGCQLPRRTTSVTREGITMTVLDPADFLDKGKTGIIPVDMWLAAVNPKARSQRAMIWTPDIPAAQR